MMKGRNIWNTAKMLVKTTPLGLKEEKLNQKLLGRTKILIPRDASCVYTKNIADFGISLVLFKGIYAFKTVFVICKSD